MCDLRVCKKEQERTSGSEGERMRKEKNHTKLKQREMCKKKIVIKTKKKKIDSYAYCSSNENWRQEVMAVWMPIEDKSWHVTIKCNEIIEFY